jgi:hypothetical protein
MRSIIISLLSLLIFSSCTTKDSFVINGKVSDVALNGSKIYLVALDGPITKDVDSTVVKDNRFMFRKSADSLKIWILRVPLKITSSVEDLVVVAEPGTLTAELSGNSSGRGLKLNEKLQVWKDDKNSYDSLQWSLYKQKNETTDPEIADSLMTLSVNLNQLNKAEILQLINENLYNGIGLLLTKVYYNDLTPDFKNKIIEQMGNIYSEKDAQLKVMIANDRNVN